jgi:type I restriction enzyme, S subunit
MSELPGSWCLAPLGDMASDIAYGFTTASTMRGAWPKLLRITDIQDGAVNWDTVPRCTDVPDDRVLLRSGDIVIARTGATTGKSYLIETVPEKAVFASYLIRVRLIEGLEPRYVWAFMQSSDYWSQIQIVSKGTAQPGASATILSEIAVPIAPLQEQRRIINKLDGLNGKSRRARDHLDRVPRLVEKYKQAILAAAFRGRLTEDWRDKQSVQQSVDPRPANQIRSKYSGAEIFRAPYEIPNTWTWLRLPELGELDRGKSRHRPRNDARLFGGQYPFIQTGEVRKADQYLTAYTKTYSDFGLSQSRLWPNGTVCITIAANIAETAILGVDACFPDSIVGFVPDVDRACPEYVEFFIRTARCDLEAFAPATAQKNINLDILAKVRIPTPPLTEQIEIVRRVKSGFAWIDRLAANATSARDLVRHLDQSVLGKAFSGELVPQDSADEPASVALERAKMLREKAPKPYPKARRKFFAPSVG